MINDELRMPVFTPSLTDRISIEVIDAKSGGGFGGEPKVGSDSTNLPALSMLHLIPPSSS